MIYLTLLLKDLRLMAVPGLSWILFILVMSLIGLDFYFVGEFDLSSETGLDDYGIGQAVLLSILGAILAPTLMFQEKDTNTLGFLDQLPISRTLLFLSRYLSVVIWIGLSLITTCVIDYTLISFFSIDSPHISTWSFIFNNFWVFLLFSSAFLAIATSISLLRGVYGWIMFALIFYLILQYSITQYVDSDKLKGIDHTHLYQAAEIIYINGEANWNVKSMGFLLLYAGIGFIISMKGYQQLNRPLHHLWITNLLNKWWTKIAIVLAFLALTLTLFVMNFIEFSEDFETPDELTKNNTDLYVKNNEYFIWMIQKQDRKTFKKLIKKSEDIYGELLKSFGSEAIELDQKITVVPTDQIHDYAGGTAHWKRIKINRKVPPKVLEQIFKHELTHVFLEIWSNGELREKFNESGIFHEGTAQFFEGSSKNEETLILKQAIIQDIWSPLSFSELFDMSTIQHERGQAMVYPFGLLFVQSIVDCKDQTVLSEIAKAFANTKESELIGLNLWEEVFNQVEISIEEVRSNFAIRKSKLIAEHKTFLDQMPKPEATLIKKDNKYFLKPLVTSSHKEARMVANIDTSGTYSRVMIENGESLIPIPKNYIEHKSIDLKLGWQIKEKDEKTIYWNTLETLTLSH